MEAKEVLFEETVFGEVQVQILFTPSKKLLQVFVVENGEKKKYEWGHLPVYNNFFAVKTMLECLVKRIGENKTKEACESDAGYQHLLHYTANMA